MLERLLLLTHKSNYSSETYPENAGSKTIHVFFPNGPFSKDEFVHFREGLLFENTLKPPSPKATWPPHVPHVLVAPDVSSTHKCELDESSRHSSCLAKKTKWKLIKHNTVTLQIHVTSKSYTHLEIWIGFFSQMSPFLIVGCIDSNKVT